MKSVIIITVMISLHYKETNYLHCYRKKNYLKNQINDLKAKILCLINQEILKASKSNYNCWKSLQLMWTYLTRI